MAKLRARKETYKYLGPGPRLIVVQVKLSRGDEYFGGRIQACANVKGLTKGRSGLINRKGLRCERGDNPRVAIARALRATAASIQERSGAFKGFK